MDTATVKFIEQIQTPFLILFFKMVTFAGEWIFVLGVLFFVSLLFILKRKLKYCIPLWFATLGGFGNAFIFKEIFHRSRPVGALIVETSPSFPSAHAMISIAFYSFAFYLFAKNSKNIFLRYLSVSAIFLVPFLLGFSRLYLSVHYLSDVMAGYFLGLFWLFVAIKIFRRLDNK